MDPDASGETARRWTRPAADRVARWGLVVLWAGLPAVVWPALAAGLRPHSGAVRLTAATGGWVVWALVLLASLVPHPASLTVIRCASPGPVLASAIAAAGGHPSGVAAGVAIAWSVVLVLVAFLPVTAIVFVNGPAYPNERRFPLAPPAALLAGPIEVSWLLVTGLPVAAALLLAARQWAPGGMLALLAVPAARYLGRALHRLSRRWVVFVPAGLVLHDPLALAEPVLFRRQSVRRLAPALAGSDALDLTQHAIGLAVELRLAEAVTLGVVTRGRAEDAATAALLFTPSRPGAVLGEAGNRRLPVDSAV